jgi:quercetin dioxygenase-like cupin family protein
MKPPKLSVVANTFIKQFTLDKDDLWIGDKHTFTHQSLLAHGSVECWITGKKPSTFYAPSILVIEAGIEHNFKGLEDNTQMFCIHALRKSEAIDDIYEPTDNPNMNEAYSLVIDESQEVELIK